MNTNEHECSRARTWSGSTQSLADAWSRCICSDFCGSYHLQRKRSVDNCRSRRTVCLAPHFSTSLRRTRLMSDFLLTVFCIYFLLATRRAAFLISTRALTLCSSISCSLRRALSASKAVSNFCTFRCSFRNSLSNIALTAS